MRPGLGLQPATLAGSAVGPGPADRSRIAKPPLRPLGQWGGLGGPHSQGQRRPGSDAASPPIRARPRCPRAAAPSIHPSRRRARVLGAQNATALFRHVAGAASRWSRYFSSQSRPGSEHPKACRPRRLLRRAPWRGRARTRSNPQSHKPVAEKLDDPGTARRDRRRCDRVVAGRPADPSAPQHIGGTACAATGTRSASAPLSEGVISPDFSLELTGFFPEKHLIHFWCSR